MMASDFSMRAKWRALKSGRSSAPQKVLDRGNIVRDGRMNAHSGEVDGQTPRKSSCGKFHENCLLLQAHFVLDKTVR